MDTPQSLLTIGYNPPREGGKDPRAGKDIYPPRGGRILIPERVKAYRLSIIQTKGYSAIRLKRGYVPLPPKGGTKGG